MNFPSEININFVPNEQTALLTEISKQLRTLILLHRGEEQLAAAAKKLNISTEALHSALQDQQPKE